MEAGSLSHVSRCLWKAKIGLKRQEMTEQASWLLRQQLRLAVTWMAPNHRALGWEAEELTACCTWPCTISLPPAGSQLGRKVLRGSPGTITPRCPLCHNTRAGGEVVFFSWQGHQAGWRASTMPPNEFSPPGLRRMKTMPCSYTINTNTTHSLQFFQTRFSMKSKSK